MSLSAHPSEMGTAYILVSAPPQTYHPAHLDLEANIGEVISAGHSPIEVMIFNGGRSGSGGRAPSAQFGWIKRPVSYKVAPTRAATPV